MDRVSVRLELVKVVYRPSSALAGQDAVMHARELEKYIFEPSPEETNKKPAEPVSQPAPASKGKPGDKNKKSDNSVLD